MAPEKPVASSEAGDEADLAKAFQELAKGERTATALENQLSQMEERIEALLAQAEREQREVHGAQHERMSFQAQGQEQQSEKSSGEDK